MASARPPPSPHPKLSPQGGLGAILKMSPAPVGDWLGSQCAVEVDLDADFVLVCWWVDALALCELAVATFSGFTWGLLA